MTPDVNWTAYANCATTDPDLFFSESESYTAARKVCDFCPVRKQCLQEALDENEVYGMRGGLTPNERKALRREAAA